MVSRLIANPKLSEYRENRLAVFVGGDALFIQAVELAMFYDQCVR